MQFYYKCPRRAVAELFFCMPGFPRSNPAGDFLVHYCIFWLSQGKGGSSLAKNVQFSAAFSSYETQCTFLFLVSSICYKKEEFRKVSEISKILKKPSQNTTFTIVEKWKIGVLQKSLVQIKNPFSRMLH